MGGFLSTFRTLIGGKKEIRILILGLVRTPYLHNDREVADDKCE
jgi:hypothetical protein